MRRRHPATHTGARHNRQATTTIGRGCARYGHKGATGIRFGNARWQNPADEGFDGNPQPPREIQLMRKKHPVVICPVPDSCEPLMEYETIFNNAFVGIAFTRNRVITRSNPRCGEIFGYSPEELNGVSARMLFPSDTDYELAGDAAFTALKQKREFGGEVLMRRKSGECFWCGFSGTIVGPAATAGVVETVWIFQDIDDRKRAELALASAHQELETRVEQRTARLEAANRMLQAEMQARRRIEEKHQGQQAELARMARINTAGEMVSSLAHELGQPLASMLNYVHGCLLRLATGNATPEELRHGLVQAVRNAEQAGEIVRRVRRFLHKRPPEKRLHNINQVLNEIAAFLDAEARRQEVTLRIRRTERPLKILVDRVEFEQVIVNLVKNAFEAMAGTSGRPKTVEISCLESARNTVVVAVADNGPGVPPYLRESIFEPFFTTKDKGMGFGLAICCSLIETQGGKIRLGESWLGGASFEVILPSGETP
ncbi:MAG: PAS domain S-box protein [Betaproteobacteria bacterium]|nr:PAS domain S-box protein [Betaproteobacteria bacterium]